MEIGKRIQTLRREKNLTQEQLAAALGVTSAAVSKWETNAAIPDVAMLCPLARMLGTTVDGLLDFRPALEAEEINALLEKRRRMFEEKKTDEAVASCEALLREYPNDLQLKCAVAGLYIMYISAISDTDWIQNQMERAAALLEQCKESPDHTLAANSRSMLVSLYMIQDKLDRALEILDEQPDAENNARILRANVLLRKNELDEAEKLYQTELWTSCRNVTLSLAGLHTAARARKDWAGALEFLDAARAVEQALGTQETVGMSPSLLLMRSGVLLRMGRIDEAVESLTGFVDLSLAACRRLNQGGKPESRFFGKLDFHASGTSSERLAGSVRTVLEESGRMEELKDREDVNALLSKLDGAVSSV